MIQFDSEKLDWTKVNGLMPAIIQDENTGQVLMLAYMNELALQQTLETKKVTFYSRTKERLWVKGETSGNYLNLISIKMDCDQDSLLVIVKAEGPTCHQGTISCFENDNPNFSTLQKLEKIIRQRQKDKPSDSYTTSLFAEGINKIAQKVGEEATEVVIAGLNESSKNLKEETSDLLYHLLVLLRQRDVDLAEVFEVLNNR